MANITGHLQETITEAILFTAGEITKRVLKLIDMDTEVREDADEDDFDTWMTYAIPDEAVMMKDYDALIDIAIDEAEYCEMIDLFTHMQERF